MLNLQTAPLQTRNFGAQTEFNNLSSPQQLAPEIPTLDSVLKGLDNNAAAAKLTDTFFTFSGNNELTSFTPISKTDTSPFSGALEISAPPSPVETIPVSTTVSFQPSVTVQAPYPHLLGLTVEESGRAVGSVVALVRSNSINGDFSPTQERAAADRILFNKSTTPVLSRGAIIKPGAVTQVIEMPTEAVRAILGTPFPTIVQVGRAVLTPAMNSMAEGEKENQLAA